MRFAEQAGLYELVEQHVTLPGSARSEAPIKVSALIAEVVVGADINSDLDVLRHGRRAGCSTGLRAAITLGSHLRGYRFGHVRQVDASPPAC